MYKGDTLGELDRPQEAVRIDEVVTRFGDAPEPALREQVALALVYKGDTLGELEQPQEAADAYDEVVTLFGQAPSRRCASRWRRRWSARGSRSASWTGRRRRSAYDEVVTRFGQGPEPALREQVATALLYKGDTLGELEQPQEAVRIYDEVVTRFGDAPESALRERVASALVSKGARLGELDRPQARQAWLRVLSEYLEHPQSVAAAAFNLAALEAVEGHTNEALRLLQTAERAGATTARLCASSLLLSGPRAELAELRLAASKDSDAMNFMGVMALLDGARSEAGDWWTRSVRKGDAVAPLLLLRLQ